jgi:hypothetical protein
LQGTTTPPHSIGPLQLPTAIVVVALEEVVVIPPNEEGETQRLQLRRVEGGEIQPLFGFAVEEVSHVVVSWRGRSVVIAALDRPLICSVLSVIATTTTLVVLQMST